MKTPTRKVVPPAMAKNPLVQRQPASWVMYALMRGPIKNPVLRAKWNNIMHAPRSWTKKISAIKDGTVASAAELAIPDMIREARRLP